MASFISLTFFLVVCLTLCAINLIAALKLTSKRTTQNTNHLQEGSFTRRDVLVSQALWGTGFLLSGNTKANAESGIEKMCSSSKLCNLSNEEMAKVITKDIVDGQFMVAADITRAVYDESATFTDEIDTYTMDKWIKGTKQLFVAENSSLRLVANSMAVTPEMVQFRFDEDLQFRIPFRPTVFLSGRVELKRDPTTGLITSYREFWDQSISTVLKSARWQL